MDWLMQIGRDSQFKPCLNAQGNDSKKDRRKRTHAVYDFVPVFRREPVFPIGHFDVDPFHRRDQNKTLRHNAHSDDHQHGLNLKAKELLLGGEMIRVPIKIKMGGHLSRSDVPKPQGFKNAEQQYDDKKNSSKAHSFLHFNNNNSIRCSSLPVFGSTIPWFFQGRLTDF